MATLGVAIYIFMGGTKKAEEDSFLFGNEDVTSDSTTFINLNTSIFSDKQVTGLRDRTTEPYTNQYSGVSYNKDTIVPPEGMSVYDPKVGKKLIIYWDKVDSGSTVRIYRSEIQDKIGEVLVDKLSDENNYQDTNLKNGAYYYYTVRTVNSEGKESSNTKQVVGIPTDSFAPQNPTGIAIRDLLTGDKIEISWINPSDLDFDHIRIYRSQKEGELGTTILDKKTEETKFIDDTVQTGITYYYTITAIDQSGNESEKTLLPSDRNSSPFEPLF
ncbi:MAG: hypothetical protein COY66_01585 [Candidatus Kerfeldbacteria bacterium CG_4_10_14_0_8_um_filter_42_10]|uniref:Fibronectin type-III domain-containing protein n=1 Tax=Candidatus Kerfeldbacteria bacterium CG_4_10_14_0_8_um_filter_42_10 TaxID=2014248 RepID=A0A2M7RJV9_9BACT|nr:MAG: hypothetical protein COY66_01585 [Candidatus Kerfeldbacteria bacterium CG_4_10_14_0_8_um_filter_42_10]